jgi:hypothetical protein
MRDGVLVEVLAVVSPIAAMLFGYLAFRRGEAVRNGGRPAGYLAG